MLRLYLRFSLLVLLSSIEVASLTQAQVSNSPVLLVDNSENQEQCSSDPSLLNYPCFSTIQAAVNHSLSRAFASSFILILPTNKPYEGFSVIFGKLRSLLIQGFRGTPIIQGRISLEGGDWIIMLKDLQLQGPGPLITMGLIGDAPPLFARLDGIIADASGTAVSVRQAVSLEITNSWFSGDGRSGCGLELGDGIISVSDTGIEGFEKGICDRSSPHEKPRIITLSKVNISYNRDRGVELEKAGLQQYVSISIMQSTIMDNGLDGLYLENVDSGSIVGNTIKGSKRSFEGLYNGLFVHARGTGGGVVSVERNDIMNFAFGIKVNGPGLVDISYNTIRGYRFCGVDNSLGRVSGWGNVIEDVPGAKALCPSPDRFPPGFRR